MQCNCPRLLFRAAKWIRALFIILAWLGIVRAGWTQQDPLALINAQATKGAAAGYVADPVCATCHEAIYKSYQHVGMAKSFSSPSQTEVIEDFGHEFYHPSSQRYYSISKKNEDLFFRRYQRDAAGNPINEFQVRIDWILGSGNRARSYLYQTEWGELFLLPLGWYTEDKKWDMSPGFEKADHLGLLRPVKRRCMFCHNAFPEVSKGSDLQWKPELFRKYLPQGTGCQRCHGPGANHVRTALNEGSIELIRSRIINPRKLPPERRDAVCFQCHMLPSINLIGSTRFDRGDYSFRPGENLSDYIVHVEVDELNKKRSDHFEINHHGYRFWQSRCYTESKGKLSCISCHNPHIKPDSNKFRARVSGVCLGCHQNQRTNHLPALASNKDCAACHMPTTRTEDVIQVTMTDHRIARGPFDHKKLIRPLSKHSPTLTNIELLPFGHPPQGNEAEIYRVFPTMTGFPRIDYTNALKNLLIRTKYPLPAPYLALIKAQLQVKDFTGAENTAKFVLKSQPDLVPARFGLGSAQLGLDRNKQAIETFEKALTQEPSPVLHYNLALAFIEENKYESALKHLNDAISMRPNFHKALMYKGHINAVLGRLDIAQQALNRSLEIEPGEAKTYFHLYNVFKRQGEDAQAQRYLEVGLRVARQPEILKPLVQQPTDPKQPSLLR